LLTPIFRQLRRFFEIILFGQYIMSVANFPPRIINFNAVSAIATVLPATPLNGALGTSIQILKRADASEIRFTLTEGVYNFSAEMTFTIADAETSAQQLELQIRRLNAGGNPMDDPLATALFSLNRLAYTGGAAVATFANISNVDYTMQCARGSLEILDGQIFGIRALINGLPVGGSQINSCKFLASRLTSALLVDKVVIA
jgi:hypothetical protein